MWNQIFKVLGCPVRMVIGCLLERRKFQGISLYYAKAHHQTTRTAQKYIEKVVHQLQMSNENRGIDCYWLTQLKMIIFLDTISVKG